MGQYRFSIYAHWQIGLMVKLDKYSIDISLPFITMHIAINKHAKGGGRAELAWDVKNMRVLCRSHHQEQDGLNLKFND